MKKKSELRLKEKEFENRGFKNKTIKESRVNSCLNEQINKAGTKHVINCWRKKISTTSPPNFSGGKEENYSCEKCVRTVKTL